MERLTPAIGAVLLTDLIRLIGEYCLSRLSWSPVLRSKRTVIADADADGLGRVLQFQGEALDLTDEEKFEMGWYAALSSAPLSELAGGSSVFSWGVRVDQWAGSSLIVGVASADASYGGVPKAGVRQEYGALLGGVGNVPMAAHNRGLTAEAGNWSTLTMPPLEANSVLLIRLTADLHANTLRVAVEHVPKAAADETAHDEPAAALKRIGHSSWVLTVPDLQRCHLHAVGGWTMRLTLTL
jgi:hypothetical protein